jgi:hypothetical protein
MTTQEDEIILEPGDEGYVDPDAPAGPAPAVPAEAGPAPAPQDLQHVRNPGETDAEFLARTRGVVVESQSPSDVVPNQPQISMSQEPLPEPETVPPPEPEPEPAEEKQ